MQNKPVESAKPCPCCGTDAPSVRFKAKTVSEYAGGGTYDWTIKCRNADCELTAQAQDRAKAMAVWNRRTAASHRLTG